MASLDYAFSASGECNEEFSSSFSYIDINEDELLHRRHIPKQTIFDNDDLQIEQYMYHTNHLDYITNYIYPFWKLQFLQMKKEEINENEFNPYSTWSNSELARHNMGLRENTVCFELKTADVTIGFCTLLLLDKYDREGLTSPFSDPIYTNSLVFYNFVIEKAFQGKGYGKVFMDQILKYIHNCINGYEYITLYVQKENIKAKHIYESFGFIQKGDNPKNSEEIIYQLKL